MEQNLETNEPYDISIVEEAQKKILESFIIEYKKQNDNIEPEPNLYIDIVMIESKDTNEKDIALRLVIPGQAILLDAGAIEALEERLKELKQEIAIASKLNIK